MDDEMDIAINYAGTFHYLRPVKRLCLGLCDEDIQKWELSFLDTKWELGIKKRRELSWALVLVEARD